MSELVISAAKKGLQTRNGTVNKDAIYIQLTGEKPEDHPECEVFDQEKGLHKLAPNMLNTAKQIVSDSGLKALASELDRTPEEIEDWSCSMLGTNKNGDFMMRLTARVTQRVDSPFVN